MILFGVGMGMVIATSINSGTFGVAPQDAGVASATVTVGQQLGASIGTSLLNTIFAGAVTAYLVASHARPTAALEGLALAHGYDTAFTWIAGIFAAGAIVSGLLFRTGPLSSHVAEEVTPAGQPSVHARLRERLMPAPDHARPSAKKGRGTAVLVRGWYVSCIDSCGRLPVSTG